MFTGLKSKIHRRHVWLGPQFVPNHNSKWQKTSACVILVLDLFPPSTITKTITWVSKLAIYFQIRNVGFRKKKEKFLAFINSLEASFRCRGVSGLFGDKYGGRMLLVVQIGFGRGNPPLPDLIWWKHPLNEDSGNLKDIVSHWGGAIKNGGTLMSVLYKDV